MLVVADQHRIDLPQRLGAHRGTGELFQVVVRAGRIERRIHHDAAARDVDDRRRAPEHTDRTVATLRVHYLTHGVAPDLVLASHRLKAGTGHSASS